MGSVFIPIVYKPKLGVYIWACKTSKLGGFFGFNVHFGTFNSVHIEVLGNLVHFVVAVGDWHPTFKKEGSVKFPKPYPSYCCQHCGDCTGWLGRFVEWMCGVMHDCTPNETGEVIEDEI